MNQNVLTVQRLPASQALVMHLSAWEAATLEEKRSSFKNQLTNKKLIHACFVGFQVQFIWLNQIEFTREVGVNILKSPGTWGRCSCRSDNRRHHHHHQHHHHHHHQHHHHHYHRHHHHLELEVDVPAGRTIGGIIIIINIIITTTTIISIVIIIAIITWNLRSMFLPVGQSEARLAGLAHEARESPRFESAILNF